MEKNVFCLILLISSIFCLREQDKKWFLDLQVQNFPLIPSYSEYYYPKLSQKMEESLSFSNCSCQITTPMNKDFNQKYSPKYHQKSPDISVAVSPPSKEIIQNWGPQSKIRDIRIFTRVSDNLCSTSRYREIAVAGAYKKKSGCLPIFTPTSTSNSDSSIRQRQKRLNKFGATLHPHHIRCRNQDVSEKICHLGKSTGLVAVPSFYRNLNQYPFVLSARNAVVSRSGFITQPCGAVGLLASCEAVNWGVTVGSGVTSRDDRDGGGEPDVISLSRQCRKWVQRSSDPSLSSSLSSSSSPSSRDCPLPVYDSVFMMTQYDDTQIGQFMQEALPKLIFHLDYLRTHPGTKIHYAFTKKKQLPSFVLPHYFFRLFGLQERLVNGTVFAKEILMPREGGCQDVGYNAWENLHLRHTMLSLAGELGEGGGEGEGEEEEENTLGEREINRDSTRSSSSSGSSNSGTSGGVRRSHQPSILILTRSPGQFTQNKAQTMTRMWPEESFPLLLSSLLSQPSFSSSHRIEIFSDQNETLMTSPLEQVKMFSRADVVIGFHGAGLANTLYMKPGGVVVEVVYDYDSRHLPLVGIFPRVSSIVGLNHYIYYIKEDDESIKTNSKRLKEQSKNKNAFYLPKMALDVYHFAKEINEFYQQVHTAS